MLFVPHDWRLALATVLLAGLIDVTLGEPPSALHPVVWMGRLIGALERRRPRGRPGAELAYGVLIVLVTAGTAFAAGLVVTLLLDHAPWWLALVVGACVLKTTFSLRGLVRAGRDVQRALASDTAAARASLKALVSRSADLDPPLIVSATIESLAENLTDSVVSPLLYYALFGLPGALAYRGDQHHGRHARVPRRPRVRGQDGGAQRRRGQLGADAHHRAAAGRGVGGQGDGRPRLVGVHHAAPAAVRAQQDAGHRDHGGEPRRAVAEAGRVRAGDGRTGR